jgi:coniferyl-aldehyde dehydrogenase
VRLAQAIVPRKRYPRIDSPDYTSIIDERSFERLLFALDDARRRGGALVIPLLPGPAFDRATRKIAPHIVLDAPADCVLMQREIFGPILPLRVYDSLDEVVQAHQRRPAPLAVYPFSHDARQGQQVLDRVMSGGVSVNDACSTSASTTCPSAASASRAWATTTAARASRPSPSCARCSTRRAGPTMKLMMPPYGKLAERVLAFLSAPPMQ